MFNANIPQSQDKRKDSQGQLLGNFQSLDTALLGVNASGLLFLQQVPTPDTATNQMAIYGREKRSPASRPGFIDPLPNVLCTRRRISGDVIEWSKQAYILLGSFNILESRVGWFRLPNGILVKFQPLILYASTNSRETHNGLKFISRADIPQFTSAPFLIQVSQIAQNGTFVGAKAFVNTNYVPPKPEFFSITVESYNDGFTGWNTFGLFIVAYGIG